MNKNRLSKSLSFLHSIIGIGILSVLPLLSACEKEEPLWKLPPPGEEEIDQVAMGETYTTTVFYKFKTQTKIERSINLFHLAFESNTEGYRVKMNNGKNVQVFNTHSTNFSETFSVNNNTTWSYDAPNGHLDSTAIGNWLSNTETRESKNEVYIIDLGDGASPKYKKFQLLHVSDSTYTIQHANTDNSNLQQCTFKKETTATFTYFDFFSNTTINYEPSPLDYDIVFTKYKHIFNEDGVITPYSVNGALLNPVNTYAAKGNAGDFASISYNDAAQLNYTNAANLIGYGWKYYNLEESKYSVLPNLFVVKDAEGVLWKLEFLDFYNNTGYKGYPKFRFQRL